MKNVHRNTTILSEINISEVQQVADQYQLDLIVLFGSYAKGAPHLNSDMDIAVHTSRSDYAKRHPDAEAFWEMALFEDLNAVLKAPYGIDLLILNRADSTLLYEVAVYGILIYQRGTDTFHRFCSYAARRFDDDAKLRRWGWEYLKRRCLP